MERDEIREVDVGDAVPVREAERLVADVLAHAADAATRHRVGPVSTSVTRHGSVRLAP